MIALKKTAILAAVLMLMAIPFVASDDSDATNTLSLGNDDIWVSKGFNDMSDGSISVTVHNTDTSEKTVKVWVQDYTSSDNLSISNARASADLTIPGKTTGESSSATTTLTFKIDVSGDHLLYVCVDGNNNGTINVGTADELTCLKSITIDHSPWKDTSTYVLIVAIVIIVVIAAYFMLRDATPRAKIKKSESPVAPLDDETTASVDLKKYEGSKDGETTRRSKRK